jgi:uncharacterized RDD family membrane protein YckC
MSGDSDDATRRKTPVPDKNNQRYTTNARGGVGRGAANRVSGGISRVAGFVVPPLVRAVDVEEVVERIDLERAVESIDVNAVAERIDLDALLARVDVNAVAERIDIDALLARVDVSAVAERIDLDTLLARVDVNAVAERIDIDTLVSRADLNALAERVDIDALLSKLDFDALVNRVDINSQLQRVDIHELALRADIGNLVAESSRDVAEDVIDLIRRQCAGVDLLVSRVGTRLAGGDPNDLPTSPPKLNLPPPATDATKATPGAVRRTMSGHYAGALSRLAAFALDSAFASGLFTVFITVLQYILSLVSDITLSGHHVLQWGLGLGIWGFLYYFLALALFGRTPGMALLGLRVVARDGSHLDIRSAFIRTLVMPLSFFLLGLGLIGIVFGRERRALHDVIAGTVVVYDWGKRIAELPTPLSEWLAKREAEQTPG